jgi:hypothetical protein
MAPSLGYVVINPEKHPPEFLRCYVADLLRRISTAEALPMASSPDPRWAPKAGHCHYNVAAWCELFPEYRPARGWLCFPGLFLAHSVVMAPNGRLFDVTPPFAPLPFLSALESEDEYAALVGEGGVSRLLRDGTAERLVVLGE